MKILTRMVVVSCSKLKYVSSHRPKQKDEAQHCKGKGKGVTMTMGMEVARHGNRPQKLELYDNDSEKWSTKSMHEVG